MILKTEPGGCGAEKATPASPRTSPSRGRSTATPPNRPASASTAARCTRGSIVVRTGLPRRGSRAGHHAVARAQDAAGRAGELGLELPLEARQPDRRVGRHAAARQLGDLLGLGGPDAPGDLGRERPELRQALLALGERRAVAGLDRRPARHPGGPGQLLPRAHARKDEVRAPVDAGPVGKLLDRQREPARQRAEDPRAQPDGHDHDAVAGLLCATRRHAGQGHRARGVAVGAAEALGRGALERRGAERPAHRGVVEARPGVGEALRGLAPRVVAGPADEHADHERDRGQDGERRESSTQHPPARGWGRSARGAGGCRHRCHHGDGRRGGNASVRGTRRRSARAYPAPAVSPRTGIGGNGTLGRT